MTHNKPPSFEIDSSPSAFDSLYALYEVNTPLELSNKFTELDQEQMYSGSYDYHDQSNPVNKFKSALEQMDSSQLSEEENYWRNEMLWFWNHHAAGYALFGNEDHQAAQTFVNQALLYQADNHANKITGLLKHLVEADLQAAESYIKTIPSDSPERASAQQAIEIYRQLNSTER